MVIPRVFIGLGGIWELTRFAFLFLVVAGSFNAALETNYNPLILWLGSGHIAVAACFLFVAVFPQRYPSYRPVLISAKGFGLFTGIGVLLTQETIFSKLSRFFSISSTILPAYAALPGSIVVFTAAIIGLDLLFFLFLVSYRHSRVDRSTGKAQNTEHMPE